MKKQFLRVKQIADQTFLRAEKSDVLTEDLLLAEKRVDSIKVSCQTAQKKIAACQIDFGSETLGEKRLRKIPQVLLGACMLESGFNFTKNSVLGDTLRECASIQTKLGIELLDYYTSVEKCMLKPVSGVLDNEVHNINKLRKQLGKLVLDMDSARTRFQTAEKHSLQASSNNNFNTVGKVDNLKEELEDASQKVDQCRDALASEMFSLISKEPQLAQLFVDFHHIQATYHRNSLAALEASLPLIEDLIQNFPQKPVYGCSLEEHLRVTNREIAQVIETCVLFLLDYGILEEGLLRIAGSASKLKKIKSALDAGIELDMDEYVRDPHAISGAFKSYLRELPEPLLTTALYNEWMNAAKLTDFESKLQALWQVLHRLPAANFKNLKYVVKFLSKVHENMDVNKMSSQNIAIVMAPNLIWSPTEDASTIGMNMSTASLHTSIVDLLISYVDWFFPEAAGAGVALQIKCPSPNLNESSRDSSSDSKDAEVNGNNLQAVNCATTVDPPSSPRSPHRKPAAPPPPAQKSMDPPTGELINFFGEPARKNTDISRPNDVSCFMDKPEESAISIEIQQKNENSDIVLSEPPSHRFEKPAVPDKPNYSSCSLDRKTHRQSTNLSRLSRTAGPSKPVDLMTRSHIERPSVPPPERPVKATKFSSSENLSALVDQNKLGKDVVEDGDKAPPSFNSCQLSSEVNDGTAVPMSNTGPATVQRSKSSTKMNRFDFLVNQKDDKPPERPPRSTCLDHPSAQVQGGKTEMPSMQPVLIVPVNHQSASILGGQPVPGAQPVHGVATSAPESSPPLAPLVGPRVTEVEKSKPPRPQPPLKPKLHLQTENTNL